MWTKEGWVGIRAGVLLGLSVREESRQSDHISRKCVSTGPAAGTSISKWCVDASVGVLESAHHSRTRTNSPVTDSQILS